MAVRSRVPNQPSSSSPAGRKKGILRGLTYAALVVLSTAFTLPFFWLLSTSFKPSERIQRWPPDILPMQMVHTEAAGSSRQVFVTQEGKRSSEVVVLKRLNGSMAIVQPLDGARGGPRVMNTDDLQEKVRPGLTWSNYSKGLVFIPFLQELKNTFVICFFAVIGTVFSCSLVAYGLSKIEWRGRGILFIVLLSTMMLPYQVTMIPIFAVFVRLGWVNTFLPLAVPAFFGNAFFIFLLRQFFMTIPKELSEAAALDGCSELDIYLRVILPLSKPALAMVGLWTFMASWNDFLGPLIYLVDESRYTLSLGLAMFVGQYGSQYGMLMAVSTVVTVPIIVLFFFTQRTFIQGITMTGLKQ